jgi:hypothetical protein
VLIVFYVWFREMHVDCGQQKFAQTSVAQGEFFYAEDGNRDKEINLQPAPEHCDDAEVAGGAKRENRQVDGRVASIRQKEQAKR